MPAYKWLFLVHGGKAKIMHIVRKTQRFHIKSILQKKKKSFSSLDVSHLLLAAVSFETNEILVFFSCRKKQYWTEFKERVQPCHKRKGFKSTTVSEF